METKDNPELVVVVAVVKTILPNNETQNNSCALSLTTLPEITDRDYLIDVINVNTQLFCDDIVALMYNGYKLWEIPEILQYRDCWEERINYEENGVDERCLVKK